MEAVKRKVPFLRFPGFSEEWNEKELKEIADIYDGTHQTPKYVNAGVKFVSVEDIDNIANSHKFITVEAFKHDFVIKPQKDDILMTRITAGIIGATSVIKDNNPLAYYVSLALIRKRKFIDVNFLNQAINSISFKHELYKRIIHVAFPKKINLCDIGDCQISFSTFSEQTKIASFLTAVDDRVHQLTRKKELLEQYKKGVMQKIFPSDDGQAPEIRFRDEEGKDYPEWEEKKLGEISDIIGGGTPDTSVDEYWDGDIQWFTPTEIKSKYLIRSKNNISELGLKNSSAKMLPLGAVLFTSRATIGDAGIALTECSTNQGFHSFVTTDNCFNEFLYYWIIHNKQNFLQRADGSTFLEIGKNDIINMPILLPSYFEQFRIASFLSSIDQKISLVTTQLENMQIWKKGLLQKMFV